MNYSEVLKNPQWQRKRLEILQRDKWKCCRCDNGRISLHVHHKQYIAGRKPWEYEDSNFETLCFVCHENEHKPKVNFTHDAKVFLFPKTGELAVICDEIEKLQESIKNVTDFEIIEPVLKKLNILNKKKVEAFKNKNY